MKQNTVVVPSYTIPAENGNIYQDVMDQVEKPMLVAVMKRVKGNQTQAAIALGVNRGTLRKKLKHHNLVKGAVVK